jgi:hypothetical protein
MHILHCSENLVEEEFKVVLGEFAVLFVDDPLEVSIKQFSDNITLKIGE